VERGEGAGGWGVRYDVFDEQELKEPARKKATQRRAKYFALTNFKSLIWFDTERVNSLRPEEEQIVEKYSLSELENLDDIEQTRYSEPIKKRLEDFLTELYLVHTEKLVCRPGLELCLAAPGL
jgi:hypothetical protein